MAPGLKVNISSEKIRIKSSFGFFGEILVLALMIIVSNVSSTFNPLVWFSIRLLTSTSSVVANFNRTSKVGLQLAPEDLDVYLGVFSSTGFPLKITISRKGNVLIAQATGQPSFSLEAYETHKFKFDQAKLKLEFLPSENMMILKQGGGKFELKKE